MGDVVGVTIQAGSLNPYSGEDVGVFIGEKHKKEAITGTCDGSNKAFILPAGKVPYMDTNNDGLIDKNEIIVYDDGVSVPVTTFDPATRTVTLETAPAAASVMTADFTELHEFIIATNFDLANKVDSNTWQRLRSNQKITKYSANNVTLNVDLDIAGKDMYKLGFDPTSKEIYNVPKEVSIAIIFFKRDTDEVDWGFFIETADLVFDDLAKVKAGDVGTASANVAARSPVKLVNMAAYPLDSGVVTTP